MKLAPLDLLVLAAYLAGILALGVSTRARSAEQYVLGDRAQPWWLILASIVATETSTVTFLSIPGFAFGLTDTAGANYQRLSYGALDAATVAEGVQRFVAAVRDWYGR